MIIEQSRCTGCGACAASCPLNCIEMHSDQEGFSYPVIDASCCAKCNKCITVCPVLNNAEKCCKLQAYGARNKDDAIREKSSSGGIFYELASYVLNNGGAVCGAAYTDDFAVEHRIIEKQEEVFLLQGAKYAQSRAEHLFEQLKHILNSDRWLLFVGTPCQVAGLWAYLGRDYPKLILVDMICHGVPSPLVWQRYLDYRAKRDAKGKKIVCINQRDKVSGWSKYRYSLRIDYANGSTYCVLQGEDPFMRGFVNNLFLRPSCAQCQFKGTYRCSDITLGDYWGVWEQHPEFDDDKGISLVLVNTEKGAQLWNAIQEELIIIPASSRDALEKNPSAIYGSTPHPKRNEFFERAENEDFEKLASILLFGDLENRSSVRGLLKKMRKWLSFR